MHNEQQISSHVTFKLSCDLFHIGMDQLHLHEKHISTSIIPIMTFLSVVFVFLMDLSSIIIHKLKICLSKNLGLT